MVFGKLLEKFDIESVKLRLGHRRAFPANRTGGTTDSKL